METDGGDFNFIATTYKGLEREAIGECVGLLKGFGDAAPTARSTEVIGLFVGHTNLDPLAVVEKLKSMVAEEPWSVRLVLRFIPIEAVSEARPEAVKARASDLSKKIPQGDSFRVTVEKRHSAVRSMEFVEAAAAVVQRRVDLDTPDWVVLVEVVGGLAGTSVIRPTSVFSSSKAKRGE